MYEIKTFNELVDNMFFVEVKLWEIIALWLKGYDDKIYFDVYIENDLLFDDIRIIDERLQPYYNYTIAYFVENFETKHDIILHKERT